jgi:PTS system glucose-specific IIC component
MMITAALTSLLTGITEPIEFAFLFVAPVLYLLHAILAASAQFVMATLDAHLGFTFSQGGIDFVLYNVLSPFSQKWWLVLVLGPLYAVIYYAVFSTAIRWLDLKTPGREQEGAAEPPLPLVGLEKARELVNAFGGAANLTALDACVTRLRVTVADATKVNAERLKVLGASGVLMVGNAVQAVFGPVSENLRTDIEAYLKMQAAPGDATQTLLHALGGADNVRTLRAVAGTRLRVELADAARFDADAARQAGVLAVMQAAPGVLHLIVGANSPALAVMPKASTAQVIS